MKRNRRIIVVGGGILGASAAWHLARAGGTVTLIERHPSVGHGVTASSFGWVGASASLPSDDPEAFALRAKALPEFARLKRDLGSLPVATFGALHWCAAESATDAMLAEHLAAGTRMEGLTHTQISEREPRLASAPPLAAWAPDDFAIEPAVLVNQLMAAACASGAEVYPGAVEAIETSNERVTGVILERERLSADVVVLANGYGAGGLASSVGVTLPLYESPAVLIRLGGEPGLVRHLICTEELEFRPTQGGGLTAAADYPEDGEAGLSKLAEHTAAAIARLLGMAVAPPVLSVTAAHRPMTTGSVPIAGFVAEIDGLYTLVAHPGVILAPLLGRLCAEAVLSS